MSPFVNSLLAISIVRTTCRVLKRMYFCQKVSDFEAIVINGC